MTRQRLTRDEHVIQGNYGHGWEDVNTEDSWTAGRKSLREYDANEPHPHRLITRRVRLQP